MAKTTKTKIEVAARDMFQKSINNCLAGSPHLVDISKSTWGILIVGTILERNLSVHCCRCIVKNWFLASLIDYSKSFCDSLSYLKQKQAFRALNSNLGH